MFKVKARIFYRHTQKLVTFPFILSNSERWAQITKTLENSFEVMFKFEARESASPWFYLDVKQNDLHRFQNKRPIINANISMWIIVRAHAPSLRDEISLCPVVVPFVPNTFVNKIRR